MLNTGTVVQLKSGGPLMTVDGTSESKGLKAGLHSCVWFEGDALKNACFVPDTLEEYTPETGGLFNEDDNI